jgi:hypothetical protein
MPTISEPKLALRNLALGGSVALSLVACANGFGPDGPGASPGAKVEMQKSALTVPVGGLPERNNRDRLLDSMARIKRSNRCAVWNSMGKNQKGVFVTLTDLLHQSYMLPPPIKTYLNPGWSSALAAGCAYCQSPYVECRSGYECNTNGKMCYVYAQVPPTYYSACVDPLTLTGGNTFTTDVVQPRSGATAERMLDHVKELHSMAAETSSCGGPDNRMYFTADDTLMYAMRNLGSIPQGWKSSGDWAGPHSPFTQSRETIQGRPRGQTHQWAWDYEASVGVQKSGMAFRDYDPHLIELDMDYNWVHDSNPECSYDGEYGRARYARVWGNGLADLSYRPVCIDDNQFFVEQQYRDVLNREGEPAGIAAWKAILDSCNYDDACLHAKQAEVANGFVSAPEVRTANPDIWSDAAASGTSFNRAFVRQLYRTYLGREPEQAGWDDWTRQLDTYGNYVTVVGGFVHSPEYMNRFPTSDS